ncbi:DUF1275 family protein [Stenotrophomonas tumulicola]|uniref:DUF1275 domain-containing protein n=1 Tax=Stenotrophomonas tumulicola TaxID=1685415 RepID=A0A7W3FN71_9GAMM|nr:DUF1275 domain-containing protein [Stenotrophomonas tumulicola]
MVPLPKWVWIGGVSLSAVAGLVNGVCYLGVSHQVVSHLTGPTSMLGVSIARGDWAGVGFLWGVLIAFCAGAVLSGLIVQDSALRLGRRYGLVLLIESGLIIASIPFFQQSSEWGVWLAAMACGLQNAMATTYSGAILRTTHLTGMFTDLGIGLGHLLRGLSLPFRRLTLSGLVISGFLLGSISGAWLFQSLRYEALYVPAAITGVSGAVYVAYLQWLRRDGRAGP